MQIGCLLQDIVQEGKLCFTYQCLENLMWSFHICRKPAMSIWAHLGRVNRISASEGLVIPIYRCAMTYITYFFDFAFERNKTTKNTPMIMFQESWTPWLYLKEALSFRVWCSLATAATWDWLDIFKPHQLSLLANSHASSWPSSHILRLGDEISESKSKWKSKTSSKGK